MPAVGTKGGTKGDGSTGGDVSTGGGTGGDDTTSLLQYCIRQSAINFFNSGSFSSFIAFARIFTSVASTGGDFVPPVAVDVAVPPVCCFVNS